ncbi:hypothetical protein D3C72_1093750 [compost metagenome]
MRARQHRLISLGYRHVVQLGSQFAQARHHDLITSARQHQCVRSVVDVFGRAGEVDEFGGAGQLGIISHFFLQPVFDSLHIMVGNALDILDATGIGFREILHQLLQTLAGGRGKAGQLRQAGVRQGDQPGHLDFHAVRHEAGFGQQTAQRVAPGSVTAIQWRKGIKLAQLIGDLHGLG